MHVNGRWSPAASAFVVVAQEIRLSGRSWCRHRAPSTWYCHHRSSLRRVLSDGTGWS